VCAESKDFNTWKCLKVAAKGASKGFSRRHRVMEKLRKDKAFETVEG
jgi:hypothetical protein